MGRYFKSHSFTDHRKNFNIISQESINKEDTFLEVKNFKDKDNRNKNYLSNNEKKLDIEELIKKGGQALFHRIFDKNYWDRISDEEVAKLLKAYRDLRESKEISDSHHGGIQNDVSKIGLLKALEDYYLDSELSLSSKKRMVEFHKNVIKENPNIFIKRQAVVNLHKIINFSNEEKREEYLKGIDKRVLYLSKLSIDEIVLKIQNHEN